jgi:ferrochelatase
MRYWRPFTEEAIAELARHAPDEIVLLPLYPQFSKTTTGSSVNEWNRRFHPNGWNPAVHVVNDFYRDPAYIDSVVSAVRGSRAQYGEPCYVYRVFSAHSVPMSVIEKGDPYQRQIEETVDLVWARGGWPARRHVCYQRRWSIEMAAAVDA